MTQYTSQIDRVLAYLRKHASLGNWVPLYAAAIDLDIPEASLSAQFRNLRKKEFGSHKIVKSWGPGFWLYQLQDNQQEDTKTLDATA